jgi:hypothetical protein
MNSIQLYSYHIENISQTLNAQCKANISQHTHAHVVNRRYLVVALLREFLFVKCFLYDMNIVEYCSFVIKDN